ncbi:DUF4190 domain-containing protein [Streptomyces sp. NPDC002588]|uniref:DUF4190 domain-containing protein n=1 Tax=Streptomyces sp. NPDC002588 TaxID=3154419 RepID=UPI0033226B83
MSIPPPSGPQQPQDPYRPPQDPQSDRSAQGNQGGQGAYPQPPYPQGPYPQGPQAPYGPVPYQVWGQGYTPFTRPAPVNGVAIAALVLGLLCFLPAVGLVLGIVALVQIRRRGERGKGMAIAGAVVSALGLALWAVSLSTNVASEVWAGVKEGARGNGSFSLAEGDCFDVPGSTFDQDVYDADKVPCSGEHDGEVFATIPLADGSYPGDDYVEGKAEDKCWTLQDGYAMDTWALTDDVDVYYLTPTSESWEWGDHEINCVFADTDESGTLTGSLRADETTLDADQLAFLKAMNAVDEVFYDEPGEYAEEDLDSNKDWAADVRDVLGEQSKVLRDHPWAAGTGTAVDALAKDMEDARADWAKAATAGDADTFYLHYDSGYDYVDGDTTVAARKALGLATTPPSYDEDDYDDGSGGGSVSEDV